MNTGECKLLFYFPITPSSQWVILKDLNNCNGPLFFAQLISPRGLHLLLLDETLYRAKATVGVSCRQLFHFRSYAPNGSTLPFQYLTRYVFLRHPFVDQLLDPFHEFGPAIFYSFNIISHRNANIDDSLKSVPKGSFPCWFLPEQFLGARFDISRGRR